MDSEGLLRDCIVKVCGVPPGDVQADTELDALGMDSLTSAEVIFEIEIQLGRELPNQLLRQVQQVRTVGDVARQLDAVLAGPPGPAAG